MFIRKEDIELKHVKDQIQDACPSYESPIFQRGFQDFLAEYFEVIDVSTMVLVRDTGSEVDMDYALERALDTTEQNALKLILDQRADYWKGAIEALETANSYLHLAYEIRPSNEAA